MKDKVKKSQVLNQLANTPRKGLYKLKDNQVTDDFNVLVINKADGKVYEADKSAFISGGADVSVLFSNGAEYVPVSRDITIEDDKKLLVLGPNVVLTTPSINPLGTTNFGVVSFEEAEAIGTFSIQDGEDPIKPLEGEVVIMLSFEGENTLGLIPPTYLTDNGLVTELKYLHDQAQNVIPLSGTVSGSPVTGDIEVEERKGLFNTLGDITRRVVFDANGNISLLFNNDLTGLYSSIGAGVNGIEVRSTNVSPRGLIGINDFTPNITDLDYTQKIYVGFRGTATLSSGTVTVSNITIKTGWKIFVSCETPSGTQGFLSASTADIVDSTSFVINSSTGALDNSTVNWWIAP